METGKQSLYSWAILLSLVLVWGSSFILIKKALFYFEPVSVGLLRVVITFLVLLPFAIRPLKTLSKRQMWLLALSGFIGSLIPAILYAFAQTEIDSSIAGTLNSMTPLFTLFLGVSFFGFRTRWYNVLGVFIGLAGAVGLIYASSDGEFIFNLKYSFLIIVATVCYAFNVNFIKKYLKDISSLTITVMTFFFVGIPAFFYVIFVSKVPEISVEDPEHLKGLGYLAILAIGGTGLALIAFNKLIKISSPIFASSVTYLIPVVAILWGIVDGEVFKGAYLVWFVIIIMGVLLVNTSPRQKHNIGSRMLFWRKRPE
jgi:drug/metabolite transporter (DMT)-like permease